MLIPYSVDQTWHIILTKQISLYEKRESADLEIVCGTKVFKVHGRIARSWSTYFAALFFGGFKVCVPPFHAVDDLYLMITHRKPVKNGSISRTIRTLWSD